MCVVSIACSSATRFACSCDLDLSRCGTILKHSNMRAITLLVVSITIVASVRARSAEEWKSRVIYQLLTDRFAGNSNQNNPCSDLSTYCKGTFRGIIRKLDYIQSLGANAIWISPIPLQTPNGYHGYWQQDLTQINPNYGTESDLKELVEECHRRDIWVMLDVVGNHVGPQKNGDWSNFSPYVPFNQNNHYHSYCLITDFNNQQQVEVCRLANLPDLDQNNNFVRNTLLQWIKNTIQKYNIDGIRIDTVPEVPKDFWSDYARSAGVFTIGEVFNGNPSYCGPYQKPGPLDALLNYPMYFQLKNSFQLKQSMRNIHDGVNNNKQHFSDVTVLGNFVDNHDNPRFLSQNGDQHTLLNALAYILFAEGIPILYYGTEQGFSGSGDPNNRESLWPHYDNSTMLFQFIANMTKFRNKQSLSDSPQIERYVDDQFFAFTRGLVFVATSNVGNGGRLSRTITYHPYNDGTVLANILDPLDMITVSNKKFQVNIESGLPKIYYPKSSIVYNTPHIWAPVNLVRGRSVSSSSDSSKNPQLQEWMLIAIVAGGGVLLAIVGMIVVLSIACICRAVSRRQGYMQV